jgi:acetyl-CoA acetyltransferase
MVFPHLQHVVALSGVEPSSVGDVCVGTVLTPDAGYYARAAMLAAGFPETVPVQVINRFCSSGLMAVTTVANQVRSGQIDIGLAIGVESMSDKYVLPLESRRQPPLTFIYKS